MPGLEKRRELKQGCPAFVLSYYKFPLVTCKIKLID